MLNWVFVCVVTACRFGHGGKVCSGDYLYQDLSKEDEFAGYMNVEGTWLRVYCISSWVRYAISVSIIGFFIYNEKK